MQKNASVLFLATAVIVLLNACASNEIGNSKDVNQATIYQQYSLAYSEDLQMVQLRAQFRFAGESGTTLILSNPSQVTFDGKKLAVDSSEIFGAYYETNFPAKDFYGSHQFSYRDINKQVLNNNFNFDVFKLLNVPDIAYKNQPLQIAFEAPALGSDDYLELSSTQADSSFSFTLTAKDNQNFFLLPVSALQRQLSSPLHFSVSLYRKMPLSDNTKEGGELLMEYHLKTVAIVLENTAPLTMLKSKQLDAVLRD